MLWKMRWMLLLLILLPVRSFALPHWKPITDLPELTQNMKAHGWRSECDAILDQLVYIRIPYWGFDNKPHEGNLIVNKVVAQEIFDIFHILFEHHFPIESMKTMDHYQNDDIASMEANNTSAFNCRLKTNSSTLSWHARGVAIDINPKINPYIKGDTVLPANAQVYIHRDGAIPGLMTAESEIVKLFAERGWEWGGNWQSLKDYQHFEKPSALNRGSDVR